jgi:hypothetical protein
MKQQKVKQDEDTVIEALAYICAMCPEAQQSPGSETQIPDPA